MNLTHEQEAFVEAVLTGTGSNLLLGKAGVGKSVCIRAVIDEATERKKRFFVLAPTGVAALNVRGETIHRFLYRLVQELNFQNAPPDFLLIDECSMVRADLLDELDKRLRANTQSKQPFGGIPIALIGDVAQLPPVVTRDEREELLAEYKSAWFFSARVFPQVSWQFHELTQIFRQNDSIFVDLLNQVRIGDAQASVDWLNANRRTDMARGTILVSTNKAAEEINLRQLGLLGGATNYYSARVGGDIAPRDYPTELELSLCPNARIMCVKNIYEKIDGDRSLLVLVNGDTGTVRSCSEDRVVFYCDRTKQEHTITKEHGRWEKIKRVFVPGGKIALDANGEPMFTAAGAPVLTEPTMEEQVVGFFHQLPVRLAWAMTVHKSQGATLHEVTLDFRRRFFAEGQAYVALSRGSSIDRLWLYGAMDVSDVKLSLEAQDFLNRRMDSAFIDAPKQKEMFA